MGQKRNVYQVSSGTWSRAYAEVFLKHGVALIGPGDPGPWSEERYAHNFSMGRGGFIGRFAEEVKDGDVFLLRTGISSIRAVGIVAGPYCYLNQFEDVNGWDLQHCRRVRWRELPAEHDFGDKVFGANPKRITKVRKAAVIDYAERFLNSPPTHWQDATLPELPAEEPCLDEVPAALKDIVAQAQDLAGLYWDRQRFGGHPSEDEIVTHLVVPFLRALGWPPEQIAVEWSKKGRKKIDVAVFDRLPRSPEHCRFVVEAKEFGAGVEGALGQAKGYIEDLGVARDVIVTDGVRYRMYSGERGYEHIAYANLIRLKRSAVELFGRMRRP